MSQYLKFLRYYRNHFEFYAKGVDPDQMPHYAASDLSLHCWPLSLLWNAQHYGIKKWLFLDVMKVFTVLQIRRGNRDN